MVVVIQTWEYVAVSKQISCSRQGPPALDGPNGHLWLQTRGELKEDPVRVARPFLTPAASSSTAVFCLLCAGKASEKQWFCFTEGGALVSHHLPEQEDAIFLKPDLNRVSGAMSTLGGAFPLHSQQNLIIHSDESLQIIS